MIFDTPKLKDIGEVFDFEYNFYTDDTNIQSQFEELFCNNYRFRHIGFDDVDEFKHYLRWKLNEIAPLYRQYYESELKSKNIDFLLNKDYTETYKKINNKENLRNENISSDSTINNNIDSRNSVNDLTIATNEENTNQSVNEVGNSKSNNDTYNSENSNASTVSSSNQTTNNNKNKNSTSIDKQTQNDVIVKNQSQKESNVANGVSDANLVNGLTGISNNVGNDKSDSTINKTSTLNESDIDNTHSTIEGTDSTHTNSNINSLSETSSTTKNDLNSNMNKSANDKITNNKEGVLNSLQETKKIDTEDRSIKDIFKDIEEYELVGKGNIGITSSASLLMDWRQSMININQMMLRELADLFILLY